MTSRWVLAVVGAFSISLLTVGSGGAATVVCNPICSPTSSASNANNGLSQALGANTNTTNTGTSTAQTVTGTTPTPCSGC